MTVRICTARRALACGVSSAVLAFATQSAFVQSAFAQEAGGQVDEIVVTGSRIRQDGMRTPVPVTVIGGAELKAMSPTTLVEGVASLPQFYNTQSPNSTASWFTRGGYGNLDIRGLGINRTLTLLNGRRVVSSTAFGGVDINVFPAAMIRSVETVTGGASAAYGTDAVAGVANFILDTNFKGLRLEAQGGLSERGDSGNHTFSGAFGTKIGDKGRLLVGAEYFHQDGVHTFQGRDWYQAWGTVADPTGKLLIRPRVVSRAATYDGLIVAAGSALNGLAFRRDGSTYAFATSDTSQGNIGAAGARQSVINGGSGDDIGGGEGATLFPDLSRYSVFSYADYELANNFTIFAQYIRGQNSTFRYNVPRGSLQGSPTGLTIFSDNAFLPDAIRQVLVAENRTSFTFRRMGSVEDIGADMTLSDKSVMNSGTAGFNWKLERDGLFNGWNVDGYYQYGHNRRNAYQTGLRVDRIFAAVDAVRAPNGQIVCRTTLFSNAFAGCQPLNLFGRGNASAAAIDYVVGNDVGEKITTPLYFADTGFTLGETDSYTAQEAKVTQTTVTQHVAELSANGEVFKGWGAGPITMALGGSYRREHIRQIVRDSTNKSSDHVAGHPVLCNTDAAAIAAGLRGVSQPDCTNTVGVQFSKVSNIMGTIAVKEAFAETQIPLIAEAPMMKSVRLNLAGRWADYSGSGSIWAYKGGLDWEVVSSLRLRGTYSRDVRAANLSERFDKTGGVATITDPRYRGDGAITVTRYSGGNPAVQPEKADTLTAGAVLTPSFAPGLSFSADWYRIKIKDAIGQLGTQAVIDRCEQGAASLCTLVTRDRTTDRLVLVGDVFVNINEAVVSGLDLETSYRRDINLFGGGEAIAVRAFASWLFENSQTLAGTAKIDRKGQTGIQQSDGVAYALPKFKATGSVTYTRGPFSMFVQGRYTGSGTSENTLPAGVTLESNKVASAFYTDVRLSYRLTLKGADTEIYGNVTNLFDTDPPITPYYGAFGAASVQFNPNLFDVLGRRFVIGVRLSL